jgi:hypothetical protein
VELYLHLLSVPAQECEKVIFFMGGGGGGRHSSNVLFILNYNCVSVSDKNG